MTTTEIKPTVLEPGMLVYYWEKDGGTKLCLVTKIGRKLVYYVALHPDIRLHSMRITDFDWTMTVTGTGKHYTPVASALEYLDIGKRNGITIGARTAIESLLP